RSGAARAPACSAASVCLPWAVSTNCRAARASMPAVLSWFVTSVPARPAAPLRPTTTATVAAVSQILDLTLERPSIAWAPFFPFRVAPSVPADWGVTQEPEYPIRSSAITVKSNILLAKVSEFVALVSLENLPKTGRAAEQGKGTLPREAELPKATAAPDVQPVRFVPGWQI